MVAVLYTAPSLFFFFFFNDTATTEIYTLSLHDALPILVARARALMDQELLAMADDITRHPEVGHKEERSVKILTDYLRTHDFDVETGVAGLKTAFVARYKKGTPGPNLGVILEYDALRGTTRD